MTAPMRRFLLNRQIALEARRIAHAATTTCNKHDKDGETEPPDDIDDNHTPACNRLKKEILALAMNIKLASLQPRVKPSDEPAPALFDQPEDDDQHA